MSEEDLRALAQDLAEIIHQLDIDHGLKYVAFTFASKETIRALMEELGGMFELEQRGHRLILNLEE